MSDMMGMSEDVKINAMNICVSKCVINYEYSKAQLFNEQVDYKQI